ncbi:MAG TPA: PilZ domain-containing protein [Treponemataceae bacterium]|nr:PilZ domain-containing protein [Treponemataceae bacterium]HPS44965.1 PilZ domain-containing protein [Treponemataceae bacterium]
MTERLAANVFAFQTTIEPGYFIAAGIFFFVFFLLRVYNNRTQANGKKKKKPVPTAAPRKQGEATDREEPFKPRVLKTPDKRELREVIDDYGFSEEQADYFTRLCNVNQVGNPRQMLESPREFDEFMADSIRGLQTASASERDVERQKTLLFTIRETVENRKRNAKVITSTRSLPNGQPFTLVTSKEEHYPSVVVINSPSGLLCKVPRDIFGNELRLAIWSKARILFYTHSGQAYQFPGRILRYESGKNETMMLVAHTNSVKAFPNRRHDRRSIRTPCTFSHVKVANVVSGKHTEHKFYPSPKKFPGTITDISSGGCSIETPAPQSTGEYLSIQCILEGRTEDTIIGKIIRMDPSKEPGVTVLHIQFAKMPRATLNRIFAYIYNYGENRK